MNKLLKTITIVTMLLLTIFTAGCESQQEKFDKAEQKLINKEQVAINAINLNVRNNEHPQKNINIIRTSIKDMEPMVIELEKIAKGDKELEKRAEMRRKRLEREKTKLPELINTFRQKGVNVN